MRAHVIDSGMVVNTIEVESLEVLPGLVAAQGNEGIGWGYDGANFTAPVVVVNREALAADIDHCADALRLAIVGDPLRVEEYRVAREEAAAYIAAGYTGTVPSSVQSWATAKGWTAKQAADDIATTAQQWSNALSAIRSIRLTGKELIRGAGSDASAASTHQTVLGQLAALRAQL
jgi:hypothetical protein